MKRINMASLDGRSKLARQYKDLRNALVDELGGEEELTTAQNIIVERAVERTIRCRMIWDRLMAEGSGAIETERRYNWYANSLSQDLARLGLIGDGLVKPLPEEAPRSGPTLQEFLEGAA